MADALRHWTCRNCKTTHARPVQTGRLPAWCDDCRPLAKVRLDCKHCGCALDFARGDRTGTCDPCRTSRAKSLYLAREKRRSEREKADTAARYAAGGRPFRLADLSEDERRAYLRQKRVEQYIRRHGREPKPASYHAFKRVAASLLAKMDRRLAAIEKAEANRASKPWLQTGDPAEKFRLRYRLDPEFNLAQRIRAQARKGKLGYRIASRVRSAVTAKRPRSQYLADLLGYSMADLRRHLERQFAKGMTWQRFLAAEIVIDHVTPLASFDLSNEDEVRAAWALPNLRPLWAEDNAKKAAKRLYLL